jgi:hypothetical protein
MHLVRDDEAEQRQAAQREVDEREAALERWEEHLNHEALFDEAHAPARELMTTLEHAVTREIEVSLETRRALEAELARAQSQLPSAHSAHPMSAPNGHSPMSAPDGQTQWAHPPANPAPAHPPAQRHSANREIAEYAVSDEGRTTYQLVDGAVIPAGYEVWANGIYKLSEKSALTPYPPNVREVLPPTHRQGRKLICRRPVWLAQIGEAVETGETLVQLGFTTYADVAKTAWLTQAQLASGRAITQHAACGLPVDEVMSRGFMDYLHDMFAINQPRMTAQLVATRVGSHVVGDRPGWLIGSDWVGPGSVMPNPLANRDYILAFQPHGDAASWFDKWREIRESGWVSRFLIGASFASPLLCLLNSRTFIIHHWCDSGGGKTAIGTFAMSVWGKPAALMSTMNRTKISITEIFKHYSDFPIFFDEWQVSTVTADELIYALCTGTDRERGTKEGGLRQNKTTWLTIARTTGEVPVLPTTDVGGQSNRILQIGLPAFNSKREAETLYPFSARSYGHAGPAFLRYVESLVRKPGGLECLQDLYNKIRTELSFRTQFDSNHAGYTAVVAVGQMLAESHLLGLDMEFAYERALDDATNALKASAPSEKKSYAERALNRLRDHWMASTGSYVDTTNPEGLEKAGKVYRMVGIEVEEGVAFIPTEVDYLLLQSGFNPERVWGDFSRLGWLVENSANHTTQLPIRNGKSQNHPVYFVKASVMRSMDTVGNHLRLIHGGLES